MSEIKKRMVQYLDSVHVTVYQFCNKVGMSHSILRRNTGINEENISKFIQEYPEVDVNWLITGNKNGLPSSIKEKIEQPELHAIKGKKTPSRNAKKLEAIHDEMKQMLVEIKTLKKDFIIQKKVINSISRQITPTSSKGNLPPKNKAGFKSKSNLQAVYGFQSKTPSKS